jgi:hypothetical protein
MVFERISTIVIFFGILGLAATIYRRRNTFRYPDRIKRSLAVLVVVDVIYLVGILGLP